MIERFVIEGGYVLSGSFEPSGNKNEALAILPAALLTDEEVVLTNLPNIKDVEVTLEIMQDLGVEVNRLDDHKISVRAKDIKKRELSAELCHRIRASILFAGPMLARCGEVKLPPPGGDVIGRRRVDTHFLALRALGASIEVDGSYYINAKKLKGNEIFLDEASVTATENVVMSASLAEGTTVIYNAACEPHVQGLCLALNKMGAKISGIGSNILTIEGVKRLKGLQHEISSDYIEVGSIIGLAAVTNSQITIKKAVPEHMKMILLCFEKLGIKVEIRGEDILVPKDQDLKVAFELNNAIPKIDSAPWPGFPADMISIAVVVATQAKGTILIFEKMFESRMFFVDKLIAMGAQIVLCDPHRVVVVGPSKLHAERLISPDIRAGMALLIASLCAQGVSSIDNIGQIDRGYEQVDKRLQKLGANIKRVSVQTVESQSDGE